MKGKTINDYAKVFSVLHKNIQKYIPIGNTYEIQELYIDFENAISARCKTIYPNITVKNCIWHMPRAIERKKK